MRTPGALNKPKFTLVKLGDLCKLLQSDTLIPVRIDFIQALNINNVPIVKGQDKVSDTSREKIEFTILE